MSVVMGVFDDSRSVRRAAGVGSGARRGRGLALVLGAVLAGSLLTGCDDGSGTGTVVRVVDGDTLVAEIAGEETTVRLLNIDTPETKHPDLPVQCLGPEATEFLAERLPAGTEIELEYDEERLDRYDRTLAGVYESGSLVNAEIAAEGLGVPVYFEPNDRFLPEVEEAAATAEAEGLGLFSAAIGCTVPAQVEQLGAAADQIPATVDGDPADALAEATTLVEDAEALVESLEAKALGTGTNAVLALPLAATFADGQREAAEEAHGRAVEGRERIQGLKDDWDEEQERLRQEQERLEREQREREERERLEREEREREEQERIAQEQQEQQEQQEREERERREREAAPAKTGQGGSERSGGSSSSSGSGKKGSGSGNSDGSGGGKSSGSKSGRGSGGSGQGGSGGGKSGSGGGSSGSGGSGGGGSSSCVPYGPEISYADDGGYTGKRYGMPGGKTFRKCS
jgi:micrococcal nuclease